MHVVNGQTAAGSHSQNILAHENPEFARDGRINVLYVDGHVAAETRQEFEKQLETTRRRLKQQERPASI
ncbi:MAG: hypothetical protein IH624_07310 [Phycisphaerae bacterium]|nr:hypothetical protein [Phycisphaerae bacterium]